MDKENFLFLRKGRVLEVLEQGRQEHYCDHEHLEEETYPDLEKNIVWGFPNTKKRQHAIDPIRIVASKLTPYQKSTKLLAVGTANSSGKIYEPKILFLKVSYRRNKDDTTVTFTATDNQVYNIIPVDLRENDIKVRCNCLDMYYRFSLWNYNSGALYGRKPPMYRRKTTTYPSVNPNRVPGICKHLIKYMDALQDSGIIQLT